MTIKRGEVIRVNLNPTQGREQSGNARPCLVISNTKFNSKRKGIVIVMPITSTVKPHVKTMIPIPNDCSVYGSVIVEQIRTVDLSTRWWKTTEEILPKLWVDDVVKFLNLLSAKGMHSICCVSSVSQNSCGWYSFGWSEESLFAGYDLLLDFPIYLQLLY